MVPGDGAEGPFFWFLVPLLRPLGSSYQKGGDIEGLFINA